MVLKASVNLWFLSWLTFKIKLSNLNLNKKRKNRVNLTGIKAELNLGSGRSLLQNGLMTQSLWLADPRVKFFRYLNQENVLNKTLWIGIERKNVQLKLFQMINSMEIELSPPKKVFPRSDINYRKF